MDAILDIYRDKRTVFDLSDIAMLLPEVDGNYLSNTMGYYVKTNRLEKLRKGIYAKADYNPLELATKLFTPSYVSLEYVLQQAGILFQYDSRLTCVSYLSREVEMDGRIFSYRRIKETIIVNPIGIIQNQEAVSMATPERAFLDMLYLNKDVYFDNLKPLNRQLINRIVPAYQSAALEKRVLRLLDNG